MLPDISLDKHNIRDSRLDDINKLVQVKKKTYIQVETVGDDAAFEADAILVAGDFRADLILKDLEFVETRASRASDEGEKALLAKLKGILEKEQFIFQAGLSDSEKEQISGYALLTHKPVIAVESKDCEDINELLAQAVREAGFISFFTAGERETRAWLVKKGTTAWEAAGVIHSDIQRGFIRAEIISSNDFVQAGGETAAKQQGKMRLEPKEYVMQDGDVAMFRFNK